MQSTGRGFPITGTRGLRAPNPHRISSCGHTGRASRGESPRPPQPSWGHSGGICCVLEAPESRAPKQEEPGLSRALQCTEMCCEHRVLLSTGVTTRLLHIYYTFTTATPPPPTGEFIEIKFPHLYQGRFQCPWPQLRNWMGLLWGRAHEWQLRKQNLGWHS